MEREQVVINLSADEALVLSDWLERVQMTDLSHLIDDPAVWAPLHRIAGSLDTTLSAIFAPATPSTSPQRVNASPPTPHRSRLMNGDPATDLPKLAAPARRALASAGYGSLAQIAQATEDEIAVLHGMGPTR
ncbi:hypothetical protein [Spirillospora sp. NPDC048819]|uniref:hypothetical protein n=1 Tax=Spirillospora sp. NPDC048819 TaxID=3155268 RepID=UPI0033D5B989